MRETSPARAGLVLAVAIVLAVVTLLGSTHAGGSALAYSHGAARPTATVAGSAIGNPVAASPTPVGGSNPSAIGNPVAGSGAPAPSSSSSLPTSGGAPSRSPAPEWPLVVLGLSAVAAGVGTYRRSRRI